MQKDEGARIARRIAKARRRIARGVDLRPEKGGKVSEVAILRRLSRLQEGR